ncbi:MAG: response regulator transcription factor [Ruminococcaceae bacterium]|nr:response regulator transcription factor [Oscillospiraceae bacterium]
MKVLIAEDEKDLREALTAYLEHQGHAVIAVPDGAAAVKRLSRDAFDVVVMDIMMPVMDGISAMRKIRAAGNMIPAIFLSAKAQVEDRVSGLDAGADDYLTKPFAPEELSARLSALYRRKRAFEPRFLAFGNVKLDTEAAELSAQNTIALSQKEVRLLAFLISHKQEPWSDIQLLAEVWRGENATADTVWMYVSFLNAKLASVKADVVIDILQPHTYRLRQLPVTKD